MSSSGLVFVVDDDESVRESLTSLLASFGFDALALASAEDFLATSARQQANCLILDLTMPGMSGAELQERLLLEQPGLPIIFITARIEAALRARLMAQGALACLLKPFQEEDLLSVVRAAILASREEKR